MKVCVYDEEIRWMCFSIYFREFPSYKLAVEIENGFSTR